MRIEYSLRVEAQPRRSFYCDKLERCCSPESGDSSDVMAQCEFGLWLRDKLRALRTDEGVFGSYISGILDSEDSLDDKKDAIEGTLAGFVEGDLTQHVTEILEMWERTKHGETSAPAAVSAPDVGAQMSRLLEAAAPAAAPIRTYTEEERKIREAILSQYAQLSDNDGEEAAADDSEPGLERNTNAASVSAAARERREQARLDSQKKKDKDKEDREKQKQLKEEKKEKRKTQKGERKR